MRKYVFMACFFTALLAGACSYAAEIRLNTYYPAPYGSYNKTIVRCLGVGDNNYDGHMNINDVPDPTTSAQTDSMWVANNVSIGPAFKASPKARFQLADGNMMLQNPPTGIIMNIPYYSFSSISGNWSRSIQFNDWNLSAASSSWTNTTLALGFVGNGQNYSYGYLNSNDSLSMSFMPNGDVSVGSIAPYSKFHVQGGPSLFAGGTGNSTGDLLRIKHNVSYFGTSNDAVIIEKTDNDTTVKGGMVFGFSRSNANNTLVNDTGWAVNDTAIMALRGNGTGGNVGIGATSPHLPAPNGQNANLDVNDVWVRTANYGSGQWATVMTGVRIVYGTANPQSLLDITPYIKAWGDAPIDATHCDPNLYLDVDVHPGDIIKVVIVGSAQGRFYSYIIPTNNAGLVQTTVDSRNGMYNVGTLVQSARSSVGSISWSSFSLCCIYRAVGTGTVRFQQFYFGNNFGIVHSEVAGRSMYAEIYQ